MSLSDLRGDRSAAGLAHSVLAPVESRHDDAPMHPEPPRPFLVTLAAAVFVGNVLISFALFAQTMVWSASLPATLVALAVLAAWMILQLWIARALLRRSRRGWYAGIAVAVVMLLPIRWDDTLPLLNVLYAVVSTVAFAVVLVALWRERKWFERPSLDTVSHPGLTR